MHNNTRVHSSQHTNYSYSPSSSTTRHTHTRDLMLRSTTNRHSSSTSNTHRQATHRPITHTRAQQHMRTFITTHQLLILTGKLHCGDGRAGAHGSTEVFQTSVRDVVQVCVLCVSHQQEQSTTRHKPSRPDAAAHRQHAFVIHIQNTYTPIKSTHTHIDQTHTHTNTRTRSCQHTNYSY